MTPSQDGGSVLAIRPVNPNNKASQGVLQGELEEWAAVVAQTLMNWGESFKTRTLDMKAAMLST